VHRRFRSLSGPFIKVIATGSTPEEIEGTTYSESTGKKFKIVWRRISHEFLFPTLSDYQRLRSLALGF